MYRWATEPLDNDAAISIYTLRYIEAGSEKSALRCGPQEYRLTKAVGPLD
jgi:hypothetical protein